MTFSVDRPMPWTLSGNVNSADEFDAMEPQPLPRLFDVLTNHGVPFVIVGGHAVNLHGYIRTTEDIDIVWKRTPDTEAKLLDALRSINAVWLANDKDPATGLERAVPVDHIYIRSEHLMMLFTDLGIIDLFDFIPGNLQSSVDDLFASSLEKHGLLYASREWMIKMKKAAGRHKDLADLDELGWNGQ